MASIITSISLDAETLEIKNRVVGHYQFSKFVRACLRELDAHSSPTHTTHEDARVHGLCNGLFKPVCVICWPDGAPSRSDWIAFTAQRLNPIEQPSAEKKRVVKSNFTHDYARTEGQQTPTSKTTQKKGLIRRFFAWLI